MIHTGRFPDRGRAALVAVGVFCVVAVAAAEVAPEQTGRRFHTIDDFLQIDGRTRVIAHRGFSARAPENTVAAVLAAADVGAHMAEVDVSLTADGHLVLLHDEKVQRTTDGRGRIRDLPLAEVQRLDAGSWFSPEFAGEPIPTVEAVLGAAEDRILVNLEIKPETVDHGVVPAVVEVVRRLQMVDRVLISSFSPRALAQAAELAPELRTAVLYKPKYWKTSDPRVMTRQVGADAFNVNRRRLTTRMAESCAAGGIPLGVYTANTPRQMNRLLQRGVHAIFTDHPDVLLEQQEGAPPR